MAPGQVARMRARIARLEVLLRECLETLSNSEGESTLVKVLRKELRKREGSDGKKN